MAEVAEVKCQVIDFIGGSVAGGSPYVLHTYPLPLGGGADEEI